MMLDTETRRPSTEWPNLSVRPSNAPIGAEVEGVDLARPLDALTANELLDAFHTYSVLVFRNQKINEDRQIAFTQLFGELDVGRPLLLKYSKPGYPAIHVISNIFENGEPIGLQDVGLSWHSDASYIKEPVHASMLYAIEIPTKDGASLGETYYASTAAAYDALSDAMKQRIAGLKAVHRYDEKRYTNRELDDQSRKAIAETVVHPVVRTHPDTGRKCLYVNEVFTSHVVGLPEDESRELLESLYRHITQPRFVYQHKWRVGDVLIWDNYPTQHRATADYALPQRRLLLRTTVKGSVPR